MEHQPLSRLARLDQETQIQRGMKVLGIGSLVIKLDTVAPHLSKQSKDVLSLAGKNAP